MVCHPAKAEGCLPLSEEVLEDQGGQEVPWVEWEAEEETGEVFHQEDPGVPVETPQEEEMSSTEQGIGSALIQAAETRILPGEQSVISARPLSRRDFCHHPFHLRVVIVAEVAPVA